MKVWECRAENPHVARFCLRCRKQLVLVCVQCQTELPGDAAVCFACGAQVIGPPEEAEETPLVTMLFSGVKGSTAIAHEDDPERACHAALEVVAGAQAFAARIEEERGSSEFDVRAGIHAGLVVGGWRGQPCASSKPATAPATSGHRSAPPYSGETPRPRSGLASNSTLG